MCQWYRSRFDYFGTARGDSFGSRQGGGDCAEQERADGKTAGPAGATHPQAAAGRPGVADDREGVRGHDRPGHHRPSERRPSHVLCPFRRQGDAPGQPARGPAGHAGPATTTSADDARWTTRARSWLQSRDAGACPRSSAALRRDRGPGKRRFRAARIHRIIADLASLDLKSLGFKGTPEQRGLATEYIAGAFMAVLTWWLNQAAKLPPQEVEDIFRGLVMPGLATELELRPKAS